MNEWRIKKIPIASGKATQVDYTIPPTRRKPLQINYNPPPPSQLTFRALPDGVSISKTSRNLFHTPDTPMSEGAQWPTKKQTGWNPCFPSISGILPVAATCDIYVIAFKSPNKFITLFRWVYNSRWLWLSLWRSSGGLAVKNFEESSLLFFKNVYAPFAKMKNSYKC